MYGTKTEGKHGRVAEIQEVPRKPARVQPDERQEEQGVGRARDSKRRGSFKTEIQEERICHGGQEKAKEDEVCKIGKLG